MTLSSDVLPAPFGPMMARISPLRMSKETPLIALTPPKASDTFSTASSTSPATTSVPLGALMPRFRKCDERYPGRGSGPSARHPSSRRLLHRRQRHGGNVANLDARRKRALAAVLERHLGRDVGLARTAVERRDQRRVAFGDEAAADLLRARDFAVVGVELFVQDEEAANLRTGHRRLRCQRAVHLLHVLGEHIVNARMPGQLLIGAINDVIALGPVADCCQVDVQHSADKIALVAVDHNFADVGIKLELVLDVFRREQRAVVETPDIFGPVDYLEMTGLGIDEPGIAGMHPSVGSFGLRGLLRVLVVACEHAGRLEQHFAVLGDLDIDADIRLAHSVGINLAVRLGGDVDRRLGLTVELFEVDAERAPEAEDFRADCLARGVGEADARHAEPVLGWGGPPTPAAPVPPAR